MEKIIIFAEIGRTPFSSDASEKLLIELRDKINCYFSKDKLTLFLYPIYYWSQFLKWIFSKGSKFPKYKQKMNQLKRKYNKIKMKLTQMQQLHAQQHLY